MSTVRIVWRDGGAAPPPPPGTPAARIVSVVLHVAALAAVLQGSGVSRTIVEQFDEPPLVVRLAAPVDDIKPAPAPATRPAPSPVRTSPAPVSVSAPPSSLPIDLPDPAPLPVLATGELAPVGTLLVTDTPPPVGVSGGRERIPARASRGIEGDLDASAAQPVVAPLFDAAYLNNPRPPYPEAAVRRGVTGVVTLRVLVAADGRAERVEIEDSSGSRLLDESALATVKHAWRFVPAKRGGLAVAATVLVPVRFELAAR